MDAKEDAAEVVMVAENPVAGALGVLGLVKDVLGVQDVEDLVQAHARRKEKVQLVPHAIVAPAVLVRVRHVHLVEDVLDQVDAEAIAMGAMQAVMGLVKLLALVIVVGAKDHVNQHVQQDVKAVLVVLEDVVDAQEDVVDVQGAVALAMAVVTDVVGNAKTHVLPTAQQRVLVHVKLKHLEL